MQSFFLAFLIFSFSIVSCEQNNQRKGRDRNNQRDFFRLTSPYFCTEAGLSKEQKTQIKNLFQERNNPESRSREERRATQEELQKKILEEFVKTEEEKTALSNCFEQRKESNRKRKTTKRLKISANLRSFIYKQSLQLLP